MNQAQNNSLKDLKIHFIGIGGIGMSALARHFHAKGSSISGSDKENSPLINELKEEGIKNICILHSRDFVKEVNPDYVIYSTAVIGDNEEVIWAKENNKKILHRSELLELAVKNKKLISVSGTHGKTTTSSMICEILVNNKFDPDGILGGLLISKNTNTVIGNGEYFVIEADESDKSFLKGDPEISVITNIEADHLENYPDGIEEIKSSFLKFAKKQRNGLVVCLEDKITKELISANFDLNNPKIISYSTNPKDDTTLSAKLNAENNNWDVFLKGIYLTSLKLQKPGRHNVQNALAALGVGLLIGIEAEKIKTSLENYQGVKRRFQILGKKNDVTIVDDYAHHPTEVVETIKAAKELMPNRLVVVFQPHQPTRLKFLWSEFIEAFKKEDIPIFITDTYIARGSAIQGISSEALVNELNKPNVNYLPGNIEEIAKKIENFTKPNDLLLIMGAGDITNLGYHLLK